MNLTGQIRVCSDLKDVNLAVNQTISGASLGNVGQAASLTVGNGSQATLTGDFQAVVLGTPLLDWGPTLTWAFSSKGAHSRGGAQVSIPSCRLGARRILHRARHRSSRP